MGHRQGNVLVMALVVAIVVWGGVPAMSEPAPASYVLGPGEGLEISVWGYPDFTRQVTIGPDGTIVLPLIGTMTAGGDTVAQLSAAVTKAYSEYLVNPKVTVIIRDYRRIHVSVLGQVTKPGAYDLPAGARVLDFIAAAGGLTDAAATDVQLMSPGGASRKVDVGKAMSGDAQANLALRGGETLVIPEDLTNLITVAGEVTHPGRYRIKDGMKVLDILATAGGLTPNASVADAKLTRASGKSEDVSLDSLLLHQDLSANVPVRAGDTLIVPEAVNNKFYVIGDVKTPGQFVMKGDVTMLQALAMAGGPEARGMATAKKLYIVRRSGDVQPGIAAGPAISTSALPNGHTLIEADLQKITDKSDRNSDLPIRAGDVLVVPQTGMSSFLNFLGVLTGGIGNFVRF